MYRKIIINATTSRHGKVAHDLVQTVDQVAQQFSEADDVDGDVFVLERPHGVERVAELLEVQRLAGLAVLWSSSGTKIMLERRSLDDQ